MMPRMPRNLFFGILLHLLLKLLLFPLPKDSPMEILRFQIGCHDKIRVKKNRQEIYRNLDLP
jgi:hypothetical protein